MTHPPPLVGPQDTQQPTPERPRQPFASAPYPGSPGQRWPQPPFSGGAYPAAGHPLTVPPPVPAKNSTRTVVVVAVTAAVLTLLICAGGIVAAVISVKRAASEARPAPASHLVLPGERTPGAVLALVVR
ncbi:hypothetical protein [Micromonospora sp. 067-2]|uniref:hypothetical protein n=1 Tax=Micromonospora sp. 067-2 TaxID=2789270 RepID=UPI003979DD62